MLLTTTVIESGLLNIFASVLDRDTSRVKVRLYLAFLGVLLKTPPTSQKHKFENVRMTCV